MPLRHARRATFEPLEARRLLSVSPLLTLDPAATTSTPQGYTPAQIRKAYGFDSTALDGTGQTIAIVDAYNDPNIAADLATFDSTFGLPAASLSVVSQTGSKTALPKADAGWAGEIALDIEWAHAMAPGAKILLVEAKSDRLADLLTAVDYARKAPGVSTVSMSWGTSEFYSETTYDSHFTTPAGHAGVTFVAASGDEGSWYGPEWPSSSPNVLSVGGTTLDLDAAGNVSAETPWTDSTGGFSRFESSRSYQATVTGSYSRTTPDVSFDADPETGFAVYDSLPYQGISGWQTVGGTSAGAPQWAALIALANQQRQQNGLATLDGATATLPTLYSLYNSSTSYTAAFHDVTDTTRQIFYGGRRVGWVARTVTTDVGYDTDTGLGTPETPQVVAALASANTTPIATARKVHRVTASRHARRADTEATLAIRPQFASAAVVPTPAHAAPEVISTLPGITASQDGWPFNVTRAIDQA